MHVKMGSLNSALVFPRAEGGSCGGFLIYCPRVLCHISLELSKLRQHSCSINDYVLVDINGNTWSPFICWHAHILSILPHPIELDLACHKQR